MLQSYVRVKIQNARYPCVRGPLLEFSRALEVIIVDRIDLLFEKARSITFERWVLASSFRCVCVSSFGPPPFPQ